MITENNPKMFQKFYCEICNYKCSKQSVFDKHLYTRKHKMIINDNHLCSKNVHACSCGKKYKFASGLSVHKKKCNHNDISCELSKCDKIDYKSMFIEMLGENKKMKNLLMEQQKQIGELIPKLGNTTNTNSNNNFNINMFLNEKCKHALSMDEFIDRINISMKNLLFTKDNGLTDGLTNIFVENMNKLSLFERPIHCTDKKRETIYVKNRMHGSNISQWSKDEENRQVDKAIDLVSRKQMKNLKQWTDEHPNFMERDDLQREYSKLVASCSKDLEKNKITKKLCDKIYLNEKQKIER